MFYKTEVSRLGNLTFNGREGEKDTRVDLLRMGNKKFRIKF